MRNLVLVLAALLALPVHAAQISPSTADRLCAAAARDSAFGVVMDELIESGELALTAGEDVLSLSCTGGSSVLGIMVTDLQAENLEYAVIDLGLSLTQSRVNLAGQTLTLKEALSQLAAQGGAETRDFVQSYLNDLTDEDFNPNLRVSLK